MRHDVDGVYADGHVSDDPGDHKVGHEADGEEGHHRFKGKTAVEVRPANINCGSDFYRLRKRTQKAFQPN